MTAHLVVPALDADPATLSRPIITGLLRDELGYDGLVISDALEMRAVADLVGVEEAAVRSIAAGSDALCIGHDLHEEATERIHRALVSAVADGRLPAERLEEAAARVHRTRLTPATTPAPAREVGARAAARALHVHGRAQLGKPPFVVELVPPAKIAAGEAQHGLGEILAAPGVALTGPGEPEIPGDRTPVVILRDAGRHPWQAEIAARLAAERPETVFVETGLPGPVPAGGAAYLVTHGAGRVNLAAAAAATGAAG